MKIYKRIFVCMLSFLMSACIGGILVNGGGGDVGAPTLEIASGDSQIVLAWTPDPDNPGDSYVLNRDEVQIFDGIATAYNDLGLTNGTRVCYTVAAVTGTTRATSAQRCATPMAGVVLNVTNQSLSAFLNWAEVAGAVSYNLYELTSFPAPSLSKDINKANGAGEEPFVNVVSPPYTWTDLSNCETYPVKVVPVDIDGNESVAETAYVDVEPSTAGELSPTFENGGVVIESAVDGSFLDVALLLDGRIVAMQSNLGGDSAVYVYSPNGVYETDFDVSGVIDNASDLVVDADDNIFIAGQGDGFPADMRVCKLTSAGALVTSFGGVAPAPPGCYYTSIDNTAANDIVIEPTSGDLIIAGSSEGVDVWLTIWRLTSDGIPDVSFGVGGVFTYAPGGIDGAANAVVVHEGVIVAVGQETAGPFDQLMILSVDMDGNFIAVDYNTGLGNDTRGQGITVAPDGTFVIAGLTGNLDPRRRLSIWNYAAELTSLTLLDVNYYTLTDVLNQGSWAFDVEYDCRDRVVVAGMDLTADANLIAMRTDDAFGLDLSFGNLAGWFSYDDGLPETAWALTQDELGRIYVVGTQQDAGLIWRPLLMRLQ